jgi:hypothetical protein
MYPRRGEAVQADMEGRLLDTWTHHSQGLSYAVIGRFAVLRHPFSERSVIPVLRRLYVHRYRILMLDHPF